MLDAKYPYRQEMASAADLQEWFDKLKPDDMIYRSIAGRLARMRAWEAECAATDKRCRVCEAELRCDCLSDLLLDDLVPALTGMRPATMAGLSVKADAVAAMATWGAHEANKALVASLVADVRRIAGGVAS